MKFLYSLLFILSFQFSLYAQTIGVSGECITGSVTLNKTSDVNGKVAYTGTGTVMGTPNVTINIYWIDAPDNVWVVDFDGQPYFQNPCNRSTPPSTSYTSCSWGTVEGQTCTGGSSLNINGSGTLPVRLSEFVATKAGQQVHLEWKTASEQNNKGFDVQRSKDGSDWIKIGFVNSAGNSSTGKSYQFTDATPSSGKNFYRLLQYDLDNQVTHSSIVVVDFSANDFYTLQHTGNGLYQIAIVSAKPIELSIVDLSGKKLFGKTAAQGLHQLDISRYAQGIYLLWIRKGDRMLTEKLIKQ